MIRSNRKGHCLSSLFAQRKLRKAFQTEGILNNNNNKRYYSITDFYLHKLQRQPCVSDDWNTPVCKGLSIVFIIWQSCKCSSHVNHERLQSLETHHDPMPHKTTPQQIPALNILSSQAAERLWELGYFTDYQLSWKTLFLHF